MVKSHTIRNWAIFLILIFIIYCLAPTQVENIGLTLLNLVQTFLNKVVFWLTQMN